MREERRKKGKGGEARDRRPDLLRLFSPFSAPGCAAQGKEGGKKKKGGEKKEGVLQQPRADLSDNRFFVTHLVARRKKKREGEGEEGSLTNII